MKYLIFVLILIAPAYAQSENKILEIGWDSPSPVYVKEHIAEMEKLPFDGIIFGLTANGFHDLSKRPDRQHGFAGRAFGAKKLDQADYSESVAALKSIKFR